MFVNLLAAVSYFARIVANGACQVLAVHRIALKHHFASSGAAANGGGT
jgi:hypothetical protein